jgi:hypothetical protein
VTEVAGGTLAEVEVVGASPVRRQIVAIRRADGTGDSALVRRFIDMLEEPS